MQLFWLGIGIVSVNKHETESSSLMFKMFKAFVPTKPIATPQELVLPWEKNNCPSNSSFPIFSSLTEECVSWRKMKPFLSDVIF